LNFSHQCRREKREGDRGKGARDSVTRQRPFQGGRHVAAKPLLSQALERRTSSGPSPRVNARASFPMVVLEIRHGCRLRGPFGGGKGLKETQQRGTLVQLAGNLQKWALIVGAQERLPHHLAGTGIKNRKNVRETVKLADTEKYIVRKEARKIIVGERLRDNEKK